MMQNNMPKQPEKVLLHYCEGCKDYFKVQPSEWELKHMQRQKVDTWIIAKLCEGCMKRRDDAK
jgi:hypothetical protein